MTDTTDTPSENGQELAATPSPEIPKLTNEQKVLSLCTYLVPLVTNSNFLAPLIIWLLKKGEDAYTEQHAKEALNFQITYLIFAIVSYISIFLVVGIVLFPAVIITYIVFSILACVKAYKGEEYRVPVCIRFIK